jgi:DNA repair exonuclease SbcCD ATPase subunit
VERYKNMSLKPYPVLTQEMLVWSGGIVSLTQCKDLIRRYLKAISFVSEIRASLEDVVSAIHEEMTENEGFIRRCEAETREEIRELTDLKREHKQALKEKTISSANRVSLLGAIDAIESEIADLKESLAEYAEERQQLKKDRRECLVDNINREVFGANWRAICNR